jgi:hypothetical protein
MHPLLRGWRCSPRRQRFAPNGGHVLLIDIVARAAKHARRNPAMIGWAFARYQRRHQLGASALAVWLGLPLSQLATLALCRRPDPNLLCFAADVHEIALTCGCDDKSLAKLLTETEVEFGASDERVRR